MSWGFPPQVEEAFSTKEDPSVLSEKILKASSKLNWNVELNDSNFMYFTRKQKYILKLFFLKNEKTDIVVHIKENGALSLRSCGPNFFFDGGVNRENIDQLKKAIQQ